MKPTVQILFVCALCALSGCSFEPTSPAELNAAYKNEFGSEPPPSVSNLQVKEVDIRDSMGKWLRFKTDPSTLANLIAMGFTTSDRSKFVSASVNPNAPKWWSPDTDKLTSFYVCPQWRKTYQSSEAVLAHNDDWTIVYFHRSDSY